MEFALTEPPTRRPGRWLGASFRGLFAAGLAATVSACGAKSTQPAATAGSAAAAPTPKIPTALDWHIQGGEKDLAGDHAGAIAAYSNAIVLNPKDSASYSMRADIYIELGEHGKALKDLAAAMALLPKTDVTYLRAALRRGDCLLAMNEAAAAMGAYKQVLDTLPGIQRVGDDDRFKKAMASARRQAELGRDRAEARLRTEETAPAGGATAP